MILADIWPEWVVAVSRQVVHECMSPLKHGVNADVGVA